MNDQELRRHLQEAHRQLIDRDAAFRRTEEEIHRLREHQVQRLHAELVEAHTWAGELHSQLTEMQQTRAWRLAVRLRSLRPGR